MPETLGSPFGRRRLRRPPQGEQSGWKLPRSWKLAPATGLHYAGESLESILHRKFQFEILDSELGLSRFSALLKGSAEYRIK